MLFEVVDAVVALLPQFLIFRVLHTFIPQDFGVHPRDQYLFIVRTVIDPDIPAPGQRFDRPPKEIVPQLLARWLFEAFDVHPLRIYSGHHVLDDAVLSGRVHSLQHDQERAILLGIEHVLQLGKLLNVFGKLRVRVVFMFVGAGARRVVVAELDAAVRRHEEIFFVNLSHRDCNLLAQRRLSKPRILGATFGYRAPACQANLNLCTHSTPSSGTHSPAHRLTSPKLRGPLAASRPRLRPWEHSLSQMKKGSHPSPACSSRAILPRYSSKHSPHFPPDGRWFTPFRSLRWSTKVQPNQRRRTGSSL